VAQLTRAQTAGTYVTNGIVEAEEVRRAMVRDEQFDPENILTEADIHQDWGLGGADTQQEAADGQQQNVADASGLVTDEGDCGYVAGFVVQDGKILCGRRSDGQGWCGPGGHIEPKETPGVAFRREAKEEFGIDVGNITYLGNCKGKPDEILPVQIYRVNDYAGIPVCDQEEMFTATWFTPEQILAQEVPGGLVFDPFRRSVEEYLDQLGLTLDDFDPNKHKRDEDGKFSSMGNTTSKDESGKENSSKDLNDSQSHAKINSNAVSAKGANAFKVKGFPNKQKLNNHWQNGRTHAAEYAPDGITTKEQYEKRAVQLLESPCGNGIKGYKTKDGLICRYDTKKNDFAKGSPEKGVRTMFKPDDGEEYYRRRLEAEGIENDE
jgi:8-oxo-dGTP pyrophosphatase MutT (NUDIX family)